MTNSVRRAVRSSSTGSVCGAGCCVLAARWALRADEDEAEVIDAGVTGAGAHRDGESEEGIYGTRVVESGLGRLESGESGHDLVSAVDGDSSLGVGCVGESRAEVFRGAAMGRFCDGSEVVNVGLISE